jgi:hypothetical protein
LRALIYTTEEIAMFSRTNEARTNWLRVCLQAFALAAGCLTIATPAAVARNA